MTRQNFFQQFDWLLLGSTIALIVIGVMAIASATRGAIDPSLIARVPDQIRYAVIGVGLIFVLALVDYRLLGGIAGWLYLGMVLLLVAVLLFGVEGDGGARSWLNLGIPIQPSEIAKLLIIITLATFLANNYDRLDSLVTVVKSLIHLAIPTALIAVQPDLGMTVVLGVLWFTLLWGAGLRLRHIALMGIAGLMLMPVLWANMQTYQRERITTFISPSRDDASFYNITQAEISIGNGGLLGQGYLQGSQSQLRFLRVRHTDFIYAVFAEEFGFVGSLVLLALFAVLLWRIVRAARHAADPLGSLICYGVASFIFFQTMVSIGMNVRVLPVTGLTLPFVSAGGTSLLSTLAGIGLVQSVILRRRRV